MNSITQPTGAGASASGKSKVRAVADDVAQRVKQTADAALDSAKSVAGDLQQEAGTIASDALDGAKSFAESNKGKVAGQIDSIATALNKAAEELDGSEQQQFAGYARQLAGGVNQVSSALREKGVDELLGLVGNFAKSNTAAFIGGAALLGFAASRFAMAGLKAAPPSQPDAYPDYGAPTGNSQPLSGEPEVREPWTSSNGGERQPAGTTDTNGGGI